MPEPLRLVLAISVSASVYRFFRRLGLFGLFLMSALDSSFLVLPFGNDLLLVGLISSDRSSAIWIIYVLASAIGSVVGVLVIDLLMRKAGEKGLERFLSERRVEQLKSKLENKTGWTVFAATLMPPPFPFTPAVMTASALQCPRRTLFLAVFVGRLIRFGIVAILAIYFGRRIIGYIDSDVLAYVIYALIGIAVVASTFSLIRWLRRN
ncbi:MAG TPA: VTT domain-containing protein [Pyrinomonadaceae bacterium]|nr:VTT domain-containing protein [Pyrinomonadaceae bacterium]